MNSLFSWEFVRLVTVSLIAGASAGGLVYWATTTNNDTQPVYTPSTYRATTITGRGQFKCQTGCQNPQFVGGK